MKCGASESEAKVIEKLVDSLSSRPQNKNIPKCHHMWSYVMGRARDSVQLLADRVLLSRLAETKDPIRQ